VNSKDKVMREDNRCFYVLTIYKSYILMQVDSIQHNQMMMKEDDLANILHECIIYTVR